jgi:hypothetical protein
VPTHDVAPCPVLDLETGECLTTSWVWHSWSVCVAEMCMESSHGRSAGERTEAHLYLCFLHPLQCLMLYCHPTTRKLFVQLAANHTTVKSAISSISRTKGLPDIAIFHVSEYYA